MAATDVGKLRVVLSAETDRFNKQLAKSRKANTKLSKSMRGTAKSANVMGGAMAKLGAIAGGALGVRAIGNMVTKYVALGDEISKTSKRLGIGIEALQFLQIEAKAAGIETEAFNKAVAKFGVNVGEVAALGIGEFKNALDRLQISLTDTKGATKDIETLLVEFARKMGTVADQNERLTLAADAFGTRQGPRMLELLPLLATGTLSWAEAAKELDLPGAAEIRALEAQQDALDRLGKAWDAHWLKVFGGQAVALGFGSALDTLNAAIEEQQERLKWNPGLADFHERRIAELQEEIATYKRLEASVSELAAEEALRGAAEEARRKFLSGRPSIGARAGAPAWALESPAPHVSAAMNAAFTTETTAPESPLAAMENLQQEIMITETAYTRFADSALKENELIDASLSTVAGGLSNTIASALASGKLDFASFARSAAASLAQIITQQLIIRSLAAFGFGAADGAVIPGGVEAFAKGGIVSKPTLFAMGGGGVGLMGEESAEAIMPLRRDKSGRLGVSASGAGSSGAGGIVVNVVNNAENSPNNDARMARAIGQQVRAAWNAEARRQMQAGGTLNPIGGGV